MKILYIVEEIPFPIDKNGSTLINYHVIKNFAKNSKLDILTFGEQSDGLLFNEKLNIQLNKIYLIKNNMNFVFFKKLLALLFIVGSFFLLITGFSLVLFIFGNLIFLKNLKKLKLKNFKKIFLKKIIFIEKQ